MTIEEELKQIDFEIRRLKIQYDLWFAGTAPRPPHDQREALARQLRRFQGVSLNNMTERFIYNTVVNKFNTFQELWIKLTRTKEEGARLHPLAARKAQREAAAAGRQGTARKPASSATTAPGAARASAQAAAQGAGTTAAASAAGPGIAGPGPAATRGAAPGAPQAWRLRPAGADDPTLRGLYESFVAARQGAGESKPLAYETFAREVSRHIAALKAKSDCEAVEFKIYSRDNKVTLKARPAGKG